MATINIPIGNNIIKRGDTIQEILFSFDALDDIDLTGATIRMDLYLSVSKVLSLTSGNGITIIDDKSFKIDKIDYADNTLPVGTLKGDLEITNSVGDRLTYVDIVYTITNDYTK